MPNLRQAEPAVVREVVFASRIYELGDAGITVLESDKLDADGKFALTGLWPDVQYRLLVKLPGHERYASVMLPTAGYKSRDLGKIALARTDATVEGTVLDTAGKPIADARVFNAGDGPDPMETRTDAAGRFRLTGFRKGTAYVFAMKDGYQFAGLRTTAGATDATVKMLRNDEPAPKRPIAVATIPPEEQKKLARALLEKAWDVLKAKKKPAAANTGLALLRGPRRPRRPPTERTSPPASRPRSSNSWRRSTRNRPSVGRRNRPRKRRPAHR